MPSTKHGRARSFRQWCKDNGFSVPTGYKMANAGKVKTCLVGRRRMITDKQSDDFFDACQDDNASKEA